MIKKLETKTPVILSWSGSKDAAFCLYLLQQTGRYEIRYLLTTINTAGRIPLHGVPLSLVKTQAAATNIPLLTVEIADGNSYEQAMEQTLLKARKEGINTVVFGDLFLEDIRLYRERQLARLGLKAVFPLWKVAQEQYWSGFFQAGFKAIICSSNNSLLDPGYCGKLLDPELLSHFPPGVDPTGENGEYHSFCFTGPVFRTLVAYKTAGFAEVTYPDPVDSATRVHHTLLKLDVP